MLLVQQKTIGLTTLQGENAVSPAENHWTNNVQQKTIGLTTLQGENAVSPAENHWTNNATGRKCC